MGKAIEVVGLVAVMAAYLYGIVAALMLFFQVQKCSGVTCVWMFDGWHPLVWGVFFLMYLGLVPVVAMFESICLLIPAGLLVWLGQSLQRRSHGS